MEDLPKKVWLKHAVVPGLVKVADVFENVFWNLGSLWFSKNTNTYSKRSWFCVYVYMLLYVGHIQGKPFDVAKNAWHHLACCGIENSQLGCQPLHQLPYNACRRVTRPWVVTFRCWWPSTPVAGTCHLAVMATMCMGRRPRSFYHGVMMCEHARH